MARGKGEGSIYQRDDGYWVGAYEAGRYPNGKRRKARVVRKRKADVIAAMAELRTTALVGNDIDRRMTVATLIEKFLEVEKRPTVSESSFRQYRHRAERVIAGLGHHKVCRLERHHVASFMADLGAEGLSESTRGNILRSVIRPALQYAMDNGWVLRNVAAGVKGPKIKVVAKTDDTPEVAEVKAILAAAEGDRLYALAWLALKYGARQGELLNLRWSDIDFDAETINVRRSTTKTDAGARTLPLLPEAAKVLRAHKVRQGAERLAAAAWPADDLVFTGTYYGVPGHALSPSHCREWWHALCKRAKVRRARFHSSRHAAATLLFEQGVDVSVVSAILGHASEAITRAVYLRVRADIKRKALTDALGDVG